MFCIYVSNLYDIYVNYQWGNETVKIFKINMSILVWSCILEWSFEFALQSLLMFILGHLFGQMEHQEQVINCI